jgi:hypothetical protein
MPTIHNWNAGPIYGRQIGSELPVLQKEVAGLDADVEDAGLVQLAHQAVRSEIGGGEDPGPGAGETSVCPSWEIGADADESADAEVEELDAWVRAAVFVGSCSWH